MKTQINIDKKTHLPAGRPGLTQIFFLLVSRGTQILIWVGFLISGNVFALEPVYELDLKLDSTSHTIETKEKVIFTNPTDKSINEIYFHIYPHKRYTEKEKKFILRYAGYFKVNPYPEGFQSGDWEIISTQINTDRGKINTDYFIEGQDKTILRVDLPQALKPKEKVEIEIDFKLKIPHANGRFGWHRNIISLHRFYPILSVLDAEGWHNYPYYLYHQPYFSDSSYYKVRLTLPKDQVVCHTGILKEEILNPEGTKTLNFETELPVRDFSLVISPDFKIYEKDSGAIKIKSYYLKGDESYAKKAAEFSADLMEFYTKEFGPYPYKEFSICPVYLGYGGHETSNLALIDTRVYKLPRFLIRTFDLLISHETGHQWFFNLIGSDEYRETFLDEGLNSYGILKYLEKKYGKDCKVMVLPKSMEWLIPNFSFQSARRYRYRYFAKTGLDREVLGELASFQEPSSIFAIAYSKGSSILLHLESLLGKENFKRILKRYFQEFKFKNAKVEDFKRIAEEESGVNLDRFFFDWLETKKICDYRVKKREKNSIILENYGQIETPLKTKIITQDLKELEYLWDGKGKRHEIITEEKIKSIVIDPEKFLLEIDRVNNFSPPKLKLRFAPIYFFAYEIPVFLDEDKYNLIYGPEISNNGLGLKASFQKPYDNIVYVQSGYDFADEQFKSSWGYIMRHLFDRQMDLGIEIFDFEGENLSGGKLFLRKELWPASYGLLDINDHITFYLLKNRALEPQTTTAGAEDIENLYYTKKDQSIIGATLKLSSYGPYPDPEFGWKINLTQELAGHFLGGEDYFFRISPDFSSYLPLFKRNKICFHLKTGLGSPQDKTLYQLGGDEGLRGYERKKISGSNMFLGSVEYRFTLIDNLKLSLFDNLISLETIQGVGFFDIGKAWYKSFEDSDFKKDVGLGLRLYLDIAGFLERVCLRLDISQAINEPKKDLKTWFGLGHTF